MNQSIIEYLQSRIKALNADISDCGRDDTCKLWYKGRLREVEHMIKNLNATDRKTFIVICASQVEEVRANFTADFEITSIDLDTED